MSIPAAAKGTPLPRFNMLTPFVDVTTGILTEHGNQTLSALRDFVVGMNRVTPCGCTGTNVLVLQPNDAFPLIEKYVDYEIYTFTAEHDSTGAVTATVVPKQGSLATLKVYIQNGATQAGAGDVVANCVYLAIYADHLNAGAGGLVIK